MVKNISWSVSTKECCWTHRSNRRPPDHKSDVHSTEPPRLATVVNHEIISWSIWAMKVMWPSKDSNLQPLYLPDVPSTVLWSLVQEGNGSFSHYKSMGVHDPQGYGRFGPQGLDWRIYVGGHYTLLHTKYISCGPHRFREDLSFSHYKSMGANDPWGVASLGPRGLIGTIYVADH